MNKLKQILNINERSNIDQLLLQLVKATDSNNFDTIVNSWNIIGFLSNDTEEKCICGGDHINFVIMENIKTKNKILVGKSCYENIWEHNLQFLYNDACKFPTNDYNVIPSEETIIFLKQANIISLNASSMLLRAKKTNIQYDSGTANYAQFREGTTDIINDFFTGYTSLSNNRITDAFTKLQKIMKNKDHMKMKTDRTYNI